MFASVGEIEVRIQVRVADFPRDPAGEINSPAFLKALLGGAPAGDRAFRKLVSHLQGPLARYVGRWFRETEAVEDVLQETFLAVHLGLPRFAGKSSLTTWVYSLAFRKSMDRLAEKYRLGYGNGVPCAERREPEDEDPLPDEAAHRSLLMARILKAAEELPEPYRLVWRLREMEGRTGEEVADILGITPSLVRVRQHRARCLIGARLDPKGCIGDTKPRPVPPRKPSEPATRREMAMAESD